MATHSSTLAWKIPWMEEPGRLQSMGLLRVGHDWASSLSLFTFMRWRRHGNPLQCSGLENPRDRGAWWAAVYGVTQSRTRLKWLSSSSLKCLSFKIFMKAKKFASKAYKILKNFQNQFCYDKFQRSCGWPDKIFHSFRLLWVFLKIIS